jgi:hypothetical protein
MDTPVSRLISTEHLTERPLAGDVSETVTSLTTLLNAVRLENMRNSA